MSTSPTIPPLLTTPLHSQHLNMGARMVAFAGYDMPVSYPSGILAEHRHCRASAALFDVSHMGQLRLVGADAAAALKRWCRWTLPAWPSTSSAMRCSPIRAAASSTT